MKEKVIDLKIQISLAGSRVVEWIALDWLKSSLTLQERIGKEVSEKKPLEGPFRLTLKIEEDQLLK